MSDTTQPTTTTTTTTEQPQQEEQLFRPIKQDIENENLPTIVESMCMNCGENGETRLLFTIIPHFKEIILVGFECPHCGYRNQEVQFGGKVAEQGVNFRLDVQNEKDLNRQIVKSDSATVRIPEIDFEVPAITQKGTLNTLEGLLTRAMDDLMEQQPVRRVMDPESAEKIEKFVQELRERCLEFSHGAYTVILDDPAGNSNIENLCAPQEDPQIKVRHYWRTKEENLALGLGMTTEDWERELERQQREGGDVGSPLGASSSSSSENNNGDERRGTYKSNSLISTQEEAERFEQKMGVHVTDERDILVFHENCYNCGRSGECKMVETNIPHFKKIILMAFACDHCGYKTNEIKAGGAISEHGTRITLKVTNPEDMSRDLLKSETASVHIPEIELHITEGSMGGRFTTIEGLLEALRDQLTNMNQFKLGDSSLNMDREKQSQFLDTLQQLETGTVPFTFIVDDPVSNSYVQNLYAPDPDPNMTVETYTRSWEQDEDLGLHQMKVDNYGAEEATTTTLAAATDEATTTTTTSD